MTDLLDRALDQLVPSFDGEPLDWPDVVARSGQPRGGRSTLLMRHPRRTLLLAVLLVLVALLATPAFGVQSYVLHLLGRKNVSFAQSNSAPNVVKKEFLDLPLGAPLGMSMHVKAAQSRAVATFSVGGHPRTLWVAPTNRGGYCYLLEQSVGGCRQTAADRASGKNEMSATWMGGSSRLGVNQSIVTRVVGDITDPDAARITARYADGTTGDISFVWVSRPVAAGFFSYDIPTKHWHKATRLLSLTLSARGGRVLGRQTFAYEAHPRTFPVPVFRHTKPHQRILPTSPPVQPAAPVQRAVAGGFAVVVGHNGAVQFTQVGQTAILRELAGHSVGYNCARVTHEFGILTVRGLGQYGRLASKAGFELTGVGMPVDFCEVQASIGRTWPDRLDDRAAVEIPLTPLGRRFLADRAAARDLALFVRSRRMHALRKEPAADAKRDILHVYGKALAHSAIRLNVVDAKTLEIGETSTTGKSFTVTIRNGRIARENLKPYAFVF